MISQGHKPCATTCFVTLQSSTAHSGMFVAKVFYVSFIIPLMVMGGGKTGREEGGKRNRQEG